MRNCAGKRTVNEEIGALVTKTREAADLTQKQLADRLGVNQSRVSRIEAGEASSDISIYASALEAIGNPQAHELAEALRVSWQYLRQPSFTHPNLSDLIKIERALSKLFHFKNANNASPEMLGQADLLLRRLQDAGDFLLQLDHQINYVGEIGVGKTTAVCGQSGLLLDPSKTNDLKSMMLDTGGGRTTLCDVLVQKGERYAFVVDPLSDEEVYRLAGELCQSVFEATGISPNPTSISDYRPSEEIIRALRNMSGLLRTRRERNTPVNDPLADLAARSNSMNELQTEFASKLTLWRRTQRDIEFEGVDDAAGRRWFRETFTAINNGRHANFSIPGKVTATVPFHPLAGAPFNVALLDTRGIDGSSVRPDIVSHLKNGRAVTVLCSKWGSAPDPSIQTLLKHIVETEVDSSIFERIVIIILARSGDALSMKDDSGEYAQEISDGYDIKIRHTLDALDRERLPPVSIFAFDAASDDGVDATNFLKEKIAGLRNLQAESAHATISAVDQMLENAQQSRAIDALRSVSAELKLLAEGATFLQQDNSRIHARLLSNLDRAHPRTIWASVRRRGDYWNFDFYQHLADGAAAELKRQHSAVFAKLRDAVVNKIDRIEYFTVQKFLQQLLADVPQWESDFIRAIRHYTISTYRERLSVERIWEESEAAYGLGMPYRNRVVSEFTQWFERNNYIAAELDFKFQLAWQASFIEPLLRAAGEGLDEM
jgi:transcriptional regulator with XRE-family HTH domain